MSSKEWAEKVQNVLKNWQYRSSLSVVAFQLVTVFSPLQTNHQTIKESSEAFYHFLWGGKPHKIKRNVLINQYNDGGLKITDIFSFNKSLKALNVVPRSTMNTNGETEN